MLLFFYFGFLILGIILITLALIKEKIKTKGTPNHFIRDKFSEFLKIKPLAYKIEILEKQIQNHSVSAIPVLESENIWKAKYERLEILFQEKSADLRKIEQALNNEIKNRTGFEDFKYLLEEEIEKGKEKRRQLQAELKNLEMENENLRSKLTGLETQTDSPATVPHSDSIS
ncbi:MAG TPA: hypothetical protein VJA17_04825 [Candidatus Omnitrophota bacterium]|nr:hypothetical protein [Candidatus Omnitrophota bacterium]